MPLDPDARLTALELLVENLLVNACLGTDDPLATADHAREAMAELARTDRSGRITLGAAYAMDEMLMRIQRRVREEMERPPG